MAETAYFLMLVLLGAAGICLVISMICMLNVKKDG